MTRRPGDPETRGKFFPRVPPFTASPRQAVFDSSLLNINNHPVLSDDHFTVIPGHRFPQDRFNTGARIDVTQYQFSGTALLSKLTGLGRVHVSFKELSRTRGGFSHKDMIPRTRQIRQFIGGLSITGDNNPAIITTFRINAPRKVGNGVRGRRGTDNAIYRRPPRLLQH